MARRKPRATLVAEVPEDLKKLVKNDAKAYKKTIDGITTVILRQFFSLRAKDRQLHYAKLPNKTLGRPV